MRYRIAKDREILIDEEDEIKIRKYCWHIIKIRHHTYVISTSFRTEDGRKRGVMLQHFLLGIHDLKENKPIIRFKDGNTFNCQKKNLIRQEIPVKE